MYKNKRNTYNEASQGSDGYYCHMETGIKRIIVWSGDRRPKRKGHNNSKPSNMGNQMSRSLYGRENVELLMVSYGVDRCSAGPRCWEADMARRSEDN